MTRHVGADHIEELSTAIARFPLDSLFQNGWYGDAGVETVKQSALCDNLPHLALYLPFYFKKTEVIMNIFEYVEYVPFSCVRMSHNLAIKRRFI